MEIAGIVMNTSGLKILLHIKTRILLAVFCLFTICPVSGGTGYCMDHGRDLVSAERIG